VRLWAGLSASCCVLSDSAGASSVGGPTSPEKRRYVEAFNMLGIKHGLRMYASLPHTCSYYK